MNKKSKKQIKFKMQIYMKKKVGNWII